MGPNFDNFISLFRLYKHGKKEFKRNRRRALSEVDNEPFFDFVEHLRTCIY